MNMKITICIINYQFHFITVMTSVAKCLGKNCRGKTNGSIYNCLSMGNTHCLRFLWKKCFVEQSFIPFVAVFHSLISLGFQETESVIIAL